MGSDGPRKRQRERQIEGQSPSSQRDETYFFFSDIYSSSAIFLFHCPLEYSLKPYLYPARIQTKSRSRPSSALFSSSSSTRTPVPSTHQAPPATAVSADDLSLAPNPLTNPAHAAAAFQSIPTGSKSSLLGGGGMASLFGTDTSPAVTGLWGSAGSPETGMWRKAVCKLSGEGGWGNANVGTYGTVGTTGSALLTIYSADDNTLQHVINIHKLMSTDVRPCDKSLFNRTDVLCIWGHPAAMSLSTHPQPTSTTMSPAAGMMGPTAVPSSPIYLSFASQETHNTWLVLLRSYTAPEVYGRLLHPEQGGLYRMWRQVELVVVQSKGVNPNPANAIANIVKREASAKEAAATTTGASGSGIGIGIGGGSGSGTTTTKKIGPESRPRTADGVLAVSHNPNIGGSAVSLSTAPGGGGTAAAAAGGGGGSPTTPSTMTETSLKSWSTGSLPASLESGSAVDASTAQANNHNHHHGSAQNGPGASSSHPPPSAASREKAKEKERKEREKREKEREKERKEREKERKEREKKEMKRLVAHARHGFFSEIVLDGEVCGRTTVKHPALPTSPLGSSKGAGAFAAAVSLHGSGASGGGGHGGTADAGSLPSPEWFESFLFGDLPSFGNLLVMLWKAPEKKEKERSGEKDGDRPKSAKGVDGASGPTATTSTTIGGSSGGGGSSTASSMAPISSIATGSSAASGGSYTAHTSHHHGSGGGSGGGAGGGGASGGSHGGITAFGGAKGAVFLGFVEIALPNFRRGEWVEGWWPIYQHANQMTGGISSSSHQHQSLGHGPAGAAAAASGGHISGLGMGAGAMGLGGMSGVGGVAGALVQVGEMKLKIKVDEWVFFFLSFFLSVLGC